MTVTKIFSVFILIASLRAQANLPSQTAKKKPSNYAGVFYGQSQNDGFSLSQDGNLFLLSQWRNGQIIQRKVITSSLHRGFNRELNSVFKSHQSKTANSQICSQQVRFLEKRGSRFYCFDGDLDADAKLHKLLNYFAILTRD